MKTILKIAITFFLLFAAYFGLALTVSNKNSKLQMDFRYRHSDGLDITLFFDPLEEQFADGPTIAKYRYAIIFDAIFFFACLAGIVFAYLKNIKGALALVVVILVSGTLVFVTQQSVLVGPISYDTSMIAAILAAFFGIGGGAMLGLLKFSFSSPSPAPAP